jgi:hypothetical protein
MNPRAQERGLSLPIALLLFLAPAAVAADGTVGAQRCRQCHEFEYQVWAQGPHQRAQVALTEEQRRDAKCSNCHSVSGRPGAESTQGVDCERCHGPGKYYQAGYVMKDHELARAVGLADVTQAQCVQCHTEGAPSIKPFDFKAMWSKIDHSRAAHDAWEKAHPATPVRASAAAAPAAPPGKTEKPDKPAAKAKH